MRSIVIACVFGLALTQSNRATVVVDGLESNMGVELYQRQGGAFAYVANFPGDNRHGEITAQAGQLPDGTFGAGGERGTTGFALTQGSGSIDFRAEIHIDFHGPVDGLGCYSIFTFSVDEPTPYSIAGHFEGSASEGTVGFKSRAFLWPKTESSFFALFEDETSPIPPSSGFSHTIGDALSGDVTGSLSGLLKPGNYEFFTRLDASPTSGAGTAAGWATLSLLETDAFQWVRPVPDSNPHWLAAIILLPLGMQIIRRHRRIS